MTTITFINTDYKIGNHIKKVDKSLFKTFTHYKDVPFSCFQIFVSARSWTLPKYQNDDLIKAGNLIKEMLRYLCIHGNLIYNLCGSVKHKKDPEFQMKLSRVRKCLTEELDICVPLGAGVVVHPGSCKDTRAGLKTIAKTIEYCLELTTEKAKSLAEDMGTTLKKFKSRRKIILENAAGEGTKLAVTFEQIASIIDLVPDHLQCQVKVCIDTAHAFGAGLYKWTPQDIKRFYSDFDDIIGLQYLEVFHLNDSRVPFGSKKDRHEYLGVGYIFKNNSEGLKEFFFQARDRGIPIIGEPPAKDHLGNKGLGYRREWKYIVDLLSDADQPLEC